MLLNKPYKPPRFEVDRIHFSLQLHKAHIPIKFKCRFLIQLKTLSTISSPKIIGHSKDHYRATNSLIRFSDDEVIKFDSFLVYDNDLKRYKKKEVQIIVNLISDNRSDETKLVGRIRIDLNEFMIDNRGETIRKQQTLENCSVNKPDVAKLDYELKLLKEEKINIQTSPDKESIFSEIEKNLFSDALEYNQFAREVFGKDAPMFNQSKLNRSIHQGSKLNKSLNESYVQKYAKRDTPRHFSRQKISAKEKILQAIEMQMKKPQQNKPNNLHGDQAKTEESKPSEPQKRENNQAQSKQASNLQKNIQKIESNSFQNNHRHEDPQLHPSPKIQKQQELVSIQKNDALVPAVQQHPKIEPTSTLVQNSQTKSVLIEPDQNNHFKFPIESPRKLKNLNISQSDTPARESLISPIKRKYQSPSSKLISPTPQNVLSQRQQPEQKNFLTESMFEQQQMVIDSLQQQLQQAKQVIEQYKLEMDLLKEQTERLQKQKQTHAVQMERSRTRENLIQKNKQELQQASQQQIQKLRAQIEEQKWVLASKQESINEKDRIILQLQETIEQVSKQFQEKMIYRDEEFATIQERYLLANQQQSALRAKNQQFCLSLQKKNQDIAMFEIHVNDLKKQVQSLSEIIKNSNFTEQKQKNRETQNQVTQLQAQIEQDQINIVESELKLADLEESLIKKQKQIEKITKLNLKNEQLLKKNQQQKEKLQHQLLKAHDKFKQIEKEKYLLTQEIANINLKESSVEKLIEEKVDTYKTQLNQLTFSYEQSQNKISQLKFALQSYQLTMKDEEKKYKEQVDKLTKKLQNFNKKQLMFRQSLDLLDNQTLKIRNYIEEKQTKLRELEEIVIMKENQLIEKTDKLVFLERKLKMAENTIEELKLQLKMAQAMASQTVDGPQAGNNQEQQLKARVTLLKEANVELLQKQKAQIERLNQKDKVILQLQKSLSSFESLKREVKSLQQKAQNYEKKNTQLKDELKTLTKSNMQQRSKSDQQVSELELVYQQIEKSLQQIRTLQEEKILLNSQLQQKEVEVINLHSQYQQIRENVETLQQKLNEKENKLMQTRLLLQRSEKIQQQLNHKIISLENLQIQSLNKTPTQNQQHLNNTKEFLQKAETDRITYENRNTRSKDQEEIYRLNEQLEAYKQRQESYMCNVLDLQQKLEKIKLEKNSLLASLQDQKTSLKKSQYSPGIAQLEKKDLKVACEQLEKLIEQRFRNKQTESFIQMLISNSEIMTQSRASLEEISHLSRQKNNLQQKSRIISRQVQKIKSFILKKSELSYRDKTEIIQLLKPCQNITNELIKVAENFAKENDDLI